MDRELLPTIPAAPALGLARVLADIFAERARQDAKWGGANHDDKHGDGELALAGAVYAMSGWGNQPGAPDLPPDTDRRIKDIDAAWALVRRHSPCNHDRHNLSARDHLIRAAACIAAEVERLDRATAQPEQISNGYDEKLKYLRPELRLKSAYRADEASEYMLSVHGVTVAKSTLYKWRSIGGGPDSVKFGRAVLFTRDALDSWVQSRMVSSSTGTTEAA